MSSIQPESRFARYAQDSGFDPSRPASRFARYGRAATEEPEEEERPGLLRRIGGRLKTGVEELARMGEPAPQRVARRTAAMGAEVAEHPLDVPRQVARGLAESGLATATGASELVGADRAADAVRRYRDFVREVYGEPETGLGRVAGVGSRVTGDIAQFFIPGAGVQRTAARGAVALPRLAALAQRGGQAARAYRLARAGDVARRMAQPTTRFGRYAVNIATGTPVTAAFAAAGPEESLTGGIAEMLDSERLRALAADPRSRVALDVLADVALAGGIERFLPAPRAARAGREQELLDIIGQAEGRPAPTVEELLEPPRPAEPPTEPRMRPREELGPEELDRFAAERQAEELGPEVELPTRAMAPARARGLDPAQAGDVRGRLPNEEGYEPYADFSVPVEQLPDRTPFDTPDVKVARREALSAEPTIEIETPDRLAQREQWADQLHANRGWAPETLAENPELAERIRQAPPRPAGEPPALHLVMGPPAAGKSSAVVEPLVTRRPWAYVVDADEAKRMIPEFQGGRNAAGVHEESAEIIESRLLGRLLEQGEEIVWPAVGRSADKVQSFIEQVRELGYNVHLYLNELPPQTAAARALERWQRTGRFVDPDYILNAVGDAPSRTFEALQQHPALTSFARYSNDVPRGSNPALLASSEGFEDFFGRAAAGAPTGAGAGVAPGPGGLGVRPSPPDRLRSARATARAAPERITPTNPGGLSPATGPSGREDVVLFPGGRDVRVRYRVVDVGDLEPSHDYLTFDRNPFFPGAIQGRAYHGARGQAARESVASGAASLRALKLLDPGRAPGGPPIITPEGLTVAGNQRAMMLKRAAEMHPERYAAYRQALSEQAEQFGIAPAALEGMEAPVLVRELTDESVDLADPAVLRELNQLSDTPGMKAKDVVSEAASRAAVLREATDALQHFRATIQPEQTLRKYLDSADGGEFLRALVRDGVIPQQEMGRFYNPKTGTLNPDGKNMVERMLYAAAIGDADVVAVLPDPVRRKLDRALPSIIEVNQRGPGWALEEDLQEAVLTLSRSKGGDVAVDLFGAADVTPRARILAEFLDANERGTVVETFQRYATDAASTERQASSFDMFGYEPPQPDQVFIQRFVEENPNAPALAMAADHPDHPGWFTTQGTGVRALAVQPDIFGGPAGDLFESAGVAVGRAGRPEGLTASTARARRILADPKERFLAENGRPTQAWIEARSLVAREAAISAGELAERAAAAGAREAPALPGQAEIFGRFEGRGGERPLVATSEQLPEAGRFTAGEAVTAPKPSEIQQALQRALGLPIKEGGIRGAMKKLGSLGIYKPKERMVRLGVYGDIGTLGHEVGHDLHALLFGLSKGGRLTDAPLQAFADELGPLAAGISAGDLSEGWAEFWRRYLDNPSVLTERAPKTLAYVERRLTDQYPGVYEALQQGRDNWRLFREASPQARIRAKISTNGKPPHASVRDRLHRLRVDVIDDFAGIERAQRDMLQGQAPASLDEDAVTLARLARGYFGAAEHALERGTLDFATLTTNGKAFKEILQPVKDRLDDFRDFVVALRADELHKRTRLDPQTGRRVPAPIVTGIRQEDVEAVLMAFRNDAAFQGAARELHAYNTRLLEYLRDAGVISDEALGRILAANTAYVPFYRVMDDAPSAGGFSLGFGHLFNPAKRIRGSGRDIIDPLESIVKNTYLYANLAARQQVSNALATLAERQGVGRWLEQIPTPLKPTAVTSGELQTFFERIVPDLTTEQSDAVLNEFLTVFRPANAFGQENMISVLVGGERQWYRVDPELYQSLMGLEREQLDTWARYMAIPARTLRAGAILAPEFVIRNPARDQVMAFIQSEFGFVPGVDVTKGLFHALRKSDLYWKWKAAGGERAALVSMDREGIRRGLDELAGQKGNVVANVVKSPIETLRVLSELMEDATRLGEFARGVGQLGTSKEALQRAAAASREVSTDFARHGAKTTAVRHIAAFWNARLQGYDRLVRAFRDHPVRTGGRTLAAVTLPSIALFYVNKDDPDYWEVPQWQRDLFWLIPRGKDANGRTRFIRIPKPFELGLVFGTIPERLLEWWHGGDPEGLETTLKNLVIGESSSFLPVPTGVLPLVENYFNYSTFLERPVVPRGLEQVEPQYQAGPGTSEFARGLGRMLNYSPAKIDNLLRGYTGGLGRLATEDVPRAGRRIGQAVGAIEGPVRPSEGVEGLPGVRGFTVRPPERSGSGESTERFYRRLSEAEEAERTIRFLERADPDELLSRVDELSERAGPARGLRRIRDDLAGMRAQIRAIELDPLLSADEKRQQIEEIGADMIELARLSIERETPATR